MSAAVSLDTWLNRVHEGEALSVMAALPDESIDLVLCDPPYGITDCAWDAEIPFEALWTELRRILKPRAAAVLCASGRFTSRLIESTKSSLPCRYRWFWDRGRTSNIMNARKMPLRQVEELVVLSKKSAKYHPQMVPSAPHTVGRHIQAPVWADTFKPRHPISVVSERYPTDLLRLDKGVAADADRIHPTLTPLSLGRYMVRTYSDPGDVVLDFAAGSGSFPIAALEEGRNFIGIERNKDIRGIKTDSAMTDLCRAVCQPVRRLDEKRVEYTADCVAFAKGRALKSWRALPPGRRATVRRMGWIAEFEAAECRHVQEAAHA